ncbi:AP-1 complex subunit beta-1 [Schistosoma bovis]|uniref:AP-1 complex subunit beta-1 n=1 Tax=Schistosoma bovis TaxID=6184 RepID=A0A430QCY1_SCHBO|nr:AP-1 complex subunit beta-1 [Schistosoma bovis]
MLGTQSSDMHHTSLSALFPDVINCMQTDNLELKKLVYLYLMNYAKTQPDTAIMAVNTFVKDCDDPNPLIRALAVRTMGCIRVEKITAYLCDPLRKCLKDEDPYVRKTAAVCVAKLHDIDAQLVEDSGFLELLRDLLCDSNPMVVANAVASITEILEMTNSDSARWGQVFILDAIADYTPGDDREAQSIIERVSPRLAHANAAVVLSTVKVIMKMLEMVDPTSETASTVIRKLAPPLVTLLSAEPEIQYVALRNINLIVQKRRDILKQEIKYNDPIYVKLEKLDIMIRLINQSNIGQVLAELKEYAKEVDVDFVRKAVRAIGRCAIKIESAAERCVSALIDLIQTKVNYVVQEAVVVIKELVQTVLGLATQESDNPDLRDRGYIYWRLLSTDPAAAKEVVLAEKPLISEETDMLEPTLLDELICHLASLASVYHRPPSSFVEGRHVARRQLPARVNGVSSAPGANYGDSQQVDVPAPTVIPTQETLIGDLLDIDLGSGPSTYDSTMHQFSRPPVPNTGYSSATPDLLGDGLDDLLPGVTKTHPNEEQKTQSGGASSSAADVLADIFGGIKMSDLSGDTGFFVPPATVLLEAARGKGLEIRGTFSRKTATAQVFMELTLTNNALTPMSGFAIQFNKNSFGLVPSQALNVPTPLMPHQSVNVSLPLATTGPIAVKNNIDVFYFATLVPMHILFVEDGEMDKRVFLATWKDIPSQNEQQFTLSPKNLTADACSSKLRQNNVFTIAKRNLDGQDMLYQSMKLTNGIWVLAELKIQPDNPSFILSLKSRTMDVHPCVQLAFDEILNH